MTPINRNRYFFNGLVNILSEIPAADPDRLDLAAYAARFNAQRVTGYYSSPALESVFLELGASLPLAGFDQNPAGDLHVMTLAPVNGGGHSQIVLDWMEHFKGQGPQNLALLDQREDIPAALSRPVAASGGRVFMAPAEASWPERALWLRNLARHSRRVVLSHHMHDPLPIAAFGHKAFPRPVFFVNHGDHEFSLGRSVADLWLEFRDDLQQVTADYRGNPPGLLLPLKPRPPAANLPERRAARAKLGLPEEQTVILSIGMAYKFTPVPGYDFPALSLEILKRHPQALFLVVGPEADDPLWAAAGAMIAEKRLRLAGGVPRGELDLFLAAADLYIDSFPFGGGLATLDAISHGLPTLARFLYEHNLQSLYNKTNCLFRDNEELLEALAGLIDEPEKRRRVAEAQRRAFYNQDYQWQRARAWETIAGQPEAHQLTPDWPAPFSDHPREELHNHLKRNRPGLSREDIWGKMIFWTDRLGSRGLTERVRRLWEDCRPL